MLRAMSARPFLVVVLSMIACAGLGCAYGEIRQVVRAQFASELDCPEVFIVKRDAWYQYQNPNQFKVKGCGVVRTYTCPPDSDGRVSYDEPACKWVEGDADAPKINITPADDEMLEPLPPMDEDLQDDAQPPPPAEDDGAGDDADEDDASDTDLDADVDAEGSTSVKPAKVGGGVKVGVGKRK